MRRTLTLNPAPFRSSNLAIPPSPFSPRLPVTPTAKAPKTISSVAGTKRELNSPVFAPPSPALIWVWQCHICKSTYPLGATNRCLDDGHRFCPGVTTIKHWRNGSWKKSFKKHKACASEFDYPGWKAWGEWRRNEAAMRDDSESESDDEMTNISQSKDCWNQCNFPSECRWGGRQIPPELLAPPKSVTSAPVEPEQDQELVLELQMPSQPPTTFEELLKPSQENELSPPSPKEGREKFWNGILDSAWQRKKSKNKLVSSPLALHPIIEEPEPFNSSGQVEGIPMPESTISSSQSYGSEEGRLNTVTQHTSTAFGNLTPPRLGDAKLQSPELLTLSVDPSFDFGSGESYAWRGELVAPVVSDCRSSTEGSISRRDGKKNGKLRKKKGQIFRGR